MEVYIDGACKHNGNPSAKASFGIFWEQNSIRNNNGPVPDSYKQTNNTGELFAALKCLKQIHENKITDITIKTDSEYFVSKFNCTKFPEFQRTSKRKNMFLIGSSTFKRMSPRKMSTEKITTKVKTIRGGRLKRYRGMFDKLYIRQKARQR